MARKGQLRKKVVKQLLKAKEKFDEGMEGMACLEEILAPALRKHLRSVAKSGEWFDKALDLMRKKKKKKVVKKKKKKKVVKKKKKPAKDKKTKKKKKKKKK